MEPDYITRREFDQYEHRMAEENKRQNHRIANMEDQVKQISDMTLSIQRLADNMDRFAEEQKKTSERLKALEDVPAENWRTLRVSILTAIGSVIGTAIVAAIITHITL